MMEYLVSWEVNVDADSPWEAAEIAETIQRSARGVFTVTDDDGEAVQVDLAEDEE
jgi:hypothetical protein